ncbi:hypothetical protein SLS55_006386 [Diplodia seriata]|uniref:DUF6536 domain-containing protein n=1 Tax=Diplodia seriata TaxID=420778 RepID=A0ABR3CE24_9PEZI
MLASITAASVLLLNFVVAIWAYFKAGKKSNGHVYEGSCDDVDEFSIGIHLLINVLSTLLLGGSQYVMQCFYNSVFYSSLAHNDYDFYFASEKYLQGAAYNTSEFPSPGTDKYRNLACYGYDIAGNCISWNEGSWNTDPNSLQKEAPQWEHLENKECIQAYAEEFLATRRNLILVVDELDNTTSSLYELDSYQLKKEEYDAINPEPYYWICSHWYGELDMGGSPCSNMVGGLEADASDWTVYGYRIRYCRSEKVDPKCRLNFNLPVLCIVIAFNAVKLVCMAYAASRMHDKPLITLGDAISSFIRSPDATTRSMCLATRIQFERSRKRQDWSQAIETPMAYRPQRIRWSKTASMQHWLITVSLFIVALATVLGLLGYAVPQLKSSFGQSGITSLWNLGLGQTRSETMITGWAIPTSGDGALISAILVSNSPQLILSVIYVFFNGLCTRMLLAREWSSFARHRKALRVSSPHGEQRSTYFLQLPYRYGAPLMLYSVALHWFVSQSIFLAKVDTWSSAGVHVQFESVTTCGFSPLGMILTSIVGACLLLTGVGIGFRQLDSDMPFAGGCSAAISAACHPPEEISEKLPLQWGALPTDETSGAVGHCSFSSGDVKKPVLGNAYA